MDPISLESDASQLCNMIRCLVEEWGPDNFEIQLPRVWAGCPRNAFSAAELQFVTDDSVVLIFGNGKDSFRREIKLAPACLAQI